MPADIEYRILIPARYASQRLPGKPLRSIHGKPMIEWVYQAALQANPLEVVVATDDERISAAVEGFGGKACMTSSSHRSGSDRILEAARELGLDDDSIVVNLQGDEPLMPAANLLQVAENLVESGCDMATLHKQIDAERAQDPHQVKLVHDHRGHALYFSRACIPYDQGGPPEHYFGHIGLYAYRVGFIEQFSRLPAAAIETCESLEQLRALYNGFSIHTAVARELPGPGIDTQADLERAEQLIAAIVS